MKERNSQEGFSLLLLVFFVALVITGYLVKTLNSTEIEIQRGRKTAIALAEAKAALIGWSVAHTQYPGAFPFPDRSAGDANYDGNSDCSINVPAFGLLIGKLPYAVQSAPCVGVGASQYGISSDLMDGYGERLWYAVSRNLIRTSTAVNSFVINPASADSPIEPWLIVRDKNGQVISNRVAAVIIAPGLPVGAQDRSGGLAGANAYLDSLTIAGTLYSNADYAVASEDFIIADDMRYVSTSNPLYQKPYQFNDKLVYITIDELMIALSKRVVREAANSLRAYYQASAASSEGRFYPYAAMLGDLNNVCVEGLLQGGLPITHAASACTHPNNGLSNLPVWFIESRWQDFIYYAVSNGCTFSITGCDLASIQVGAQENVDALLIFTGAIIPSLGQVRPSASPQSYLDSVENSNMDFVFDAMGTKQANNYNDQMLIVAP